MGPQGGVDRGEAPGEELGGRAAPVRAGAGRAQRGAVEQDRPAALGQGPADVLAGHHVAGGELRARVHVLEVAPARAVPQHRALPADGLGDQEAARGGEGGRVELHELQVRHGGARPQGRGDAVTGGHGRIGGVGVELSGPAGREHHGVRGQFVEPVPGTRQDEGPGRAAAWAEHEVDQHGVPQDRQAPGGLGRQRGGEEGALDLAAGRVAAGVQDPGHGVGALETLEPGGVRSGRAVEGHTARHELVDGGRRVAHEHAHGVVVARPRPRGEGVLDVQLLGVAGLAGRERGRHGRDPALRAGRAGLVEGVLAQQRHVETVARGAQGRGEAGDAAAHHEHARCRVRAHRGSAASIRSSATSASRAVAASTEIRLITRPATSSSSTHAR